MDAVADRVIRSPTRSTAQWLEWLAHSHASGHLPEVAFDQWLAPGDRLVAIAPHPDDEVLACGGLLAMHAERGSECIVIAVTDGDASHDGFDDWDARSLAAQRRAESERGLARLGVGVGVRVDVDDGIGIEGHSDLARVFATKAGTRRLGLPDGKVRDHAAKLNDELHHHLRPGDTVVTTWRLDGHPDHDATGEIAAKVCAAIGARLIEAPVWMWHWAAPLDPRVPWHRLRALPLSSRARDRKAAALDEHETQRTPRHRRGVADGCESESPVLDDGILERARWPHEYFFI